QLGAAVDQEIGQRAHVLVPLACVEPSGAVVEVRYAHEEVPPPRERDRLDVLEQGSDQATTARGTRDGEQLEVVSREEARPDQREPGHGGAGDGDVALASFERDRQEAGPLRPGGAGAGPRRGNETS